MPLTASSINQVTPADKISHASQASIGSRASLDNQASPDDEVDASNTHAETGTQTRMTQSEYILSTSPRGAAAKSPLTTVVEENLAANQIVEEAYRDIMLCAVERLTYDKKMEEMASDLQKLVDEKEIREKQIAARVSELEVLRSKFAELENSVMSATLAKETAVKQRQSLEERERANLRMAVNKLESHLLKRRDQLG